MSRWRSVFFWSILAAAFIGPGTVTTAAKAGSALGLDLLWALLFSVAATILLQETAARLTLGANRPLGAILGERYQHSGRYLAAFLFMVIALGCGAYQMGNLLGAMAGLELLGWQSPWLLLSLGLVAALLLYTGNIQTITRSLALIVAVLGIVFCWAALGAAFSWSAVWSGLHIRITDQSALLAISLIGTTIVPYNLFLASGLSRGQSLPDMRWGIGLAVLIGGLITLAILLTGTQVHGEFSFAGLANALHQRLGTAGGPLLTIGLFAAGFSSAITAPLAAAITGRTLLGYHDERWQSTGSYFRLSWGLVLGMGLVFALLQLKPVPAIIAAQALNGLILPLVAVLLILAINDTTLLPPAYRNGRWLNILSLLTVGVTTFLGLHNIWSALGRLWPALLTPNPSVRWYLNWSVACLLMLLIGLRLPWRKLS
ncbi:MAG: divalent metal cation transporter [Bacteroidetes bacterium]|nr:MAG: divalent metal cation transporter [Bacteroidota bacterium]